MDLLHALFMQIKQENPPSFLTFLIFSLLILVFVFLTFTRTPIGFNASFQAYSLPFEASGYS